MHRRGSIPWRSYLAAARSVSGDFSRRTPFPMSCPMVLVVGLWSCWRTVHTLNGRCHDFFQCNLGEGVYQLNSLTVNNGAILTIAGGSTVNVVGTVA